MKIDSLSNHGALKQESGVQTLESRFLAAGQNVSEHRRPDPEFEHLYQLLLTMEGQGEKAIYDFLRTLRSADGTSAAYPTAQKLMTVTLQVLVRLKEEKLEGSQLFKEMRGANNLAFSMDVFVKAFMREVFEPMGDEAREKSDW
ncbi:hypothetical protein SAMN04490202_0671 [Pseudomonas reinekei]|uniref:Uncharacterized protein n=1 Tax=Pseudomonas reinekei TaxID=395598 RepID=A0A1H0IXJ5_PSERE|nr:hypothetical protein [Pseudomonas reinekei]KAB0480883.1 hypothetical protein F7R15_27010 [Pseudomonas reinekei]OLT99414.1 hypothetical protein BVK86_26270 [Pseudomonas reinekei]SDO36197.1 hypothetical protein SAMN04490202_0671 [Pseudomonas reinekei]